MTKIAAEPMAALRARTSYKWQTHPADVLPLFVAEMDYPLAGPVQEAIIARVLASDTGYIAGPGPVAAAFAATAAPFAASALQFTKTVSAIMRSPIRS